MEEDGNILSSKPSSLTQCLGSQISFAEPGNCQSSSYVGCFLAKMICSLLQIAANGNNSTGKEPGECQTFLEMPQSLLMRGLACSTICQGCAFIINQLWRQHELKCHQKRGNKSVLTAVHLLQGKICEQKVGLSVLNK